MDRDTVLRNAAAYDCGFDPHIVAEFWANYLGAEISAADVAAMMALVEVARISRICAESVSDACYMRFASYAAMCGEKEK